jgi:hypothetical protein
MTSYTNRSAEFSRGCSKREEQAFSIPIPERAYFSRLEYSRLLALADIRDMPDCAIVGIILETEKIEEAPLNPT